MKNASPWQLDLFEGLITADPLQRRFEHLSALARAIPEALRFGTSSWSFPGWAGLVYPAGQTRATLARDGLALYVRHPLMRTVGLDRGYYAPISAHDLDGYAEQLPAGFPCCAKVPEAFTCPVYLGRGHREVGSPNESFLAAGPFEAQVVSPFLDSFRDHTAALVLEFPPVPARYRLAPPTFYELLDGFLARVPRELPVAVELRDERFLTAEYGQLLRAHRASHVYNYWSAMPMVARQMEVVPPGTGPIVIARLMLRPCTRYEERKRDMAPFDRILDPNPQMRGEVLDLVEEALRAHCPPFVLVNNKAEGSAPLTIEALAQGWADRHPA